MDAFKGKKILGWVRVIRQSGRRTLHRVPIS
jgi:hypothetical protein